MRNVFFFLFSAASAFQSLSSAPSRVSSVILRESYKGETSMYSAKDEVVDQSTNSKIRPLHQNWWPVTATSALDPTRPNAVELLNKKLVLFQSEGQWNCLEDRCSHRFAPLTEGRVISSQGKACLQCAYHGWEFNADGSCQRAPQVESMRGIGGVEAFPTRVQAGMVFVWADPASRELGESIPLPIFPLLERYVSVHGDSACFMRDLPYGYELLGENLLDLSHLPFSHHGVGGLDRDNGCPLPFKMLSPSEKSADNPFYEAFLEDAATTDPSFKGRPVPANSTLHLGFYDPCHVRYTRKTVPGQTSYVALFLTPTSATKSRVFLFNIMEAFLQQPTSPSKKSSLQRLKEWTSPSILKRKIQAAAMRRIFTPVTRHLFTHQIFDGDGIFLHKQGDRMQRAGLTYLDYKTPASADVLVNAFRRYLNSACKLTRKAGKDSMADAAMPAAGYSDSLPRSQMLDRYESHTKHCKVCSAALEEKQKTRRLLDWVQPALIGAAGASSTAFTAIAILGFTRQVTIPRAFVRVAAVALTSTVGASIGIFKMRKKVEKDIQQFVFEDYIHAEKV